MKEKWKTPAGTAVLAALICGVITHLFGLVTILHNYDDISQQPKGYGTGVTSGRWLLGMIGDVSELLGGNYNLPTVNGLIFIVLLACAAAVMVLAFRISSRTMAACVGMLVVVFPPVFSAMTFRYTVIYYGIGFLMAVLAAWVPGRFRLGWLYSALLIACSLGIYQAYVPVTISMMVLLLLQMTLSGQADWKKVLFQGLRYCGMLLLGLAFYFPFLKAALAFYGTELSDYQGVNDMGRLTAAELVHQVRLAYYLYLKTPFQDFWGLVNVLPLKVLYLLLECVSAGLVVWLVYSQARSWQMAVLALLLCAVFPMAVCFVMIMCPKSDVYTIMLFAFVLVPCMPVVLLTCMPESGGLGRLLNKGVAAALVLMIASYAYQTNVQYSCMYFANRQMENYLSSLVTQVRMTEGFTSDKEWAFLGKIDDPLLRCYWEYETDYGGLEFTQSLLRRYSWDNWMYYYCGYMPPMANEEKMDELTDAAEVRQMPCWPDAGSIRVIGDTVVVKFSEAE